MIKYHPSGSIEMREIADFICRFLPFYGHLHSPLQVEGNEGLISV